MASSWVSGRSSTIPSKTTAKAILKKTQVRTPLSLEEKKAGLLRRGAVLDELHRGRTDPLTSQKSITAAQNGSISYAAALGSQVGERYRANLSQTFVSIETTKNDQTRRVWANPASNTEYEKLTRPQLAVSGASAMTGLQISDKSPLEALSSNNLPNVAGALRREDMTRPTAHETFN